MQICKISDLLAGVSGFGIMKPVAGSAAPAFYAVVTPALVAKAVHQSAPCLGLQSQ
jgi:hypothetical protein